MATLENVKYINFYVSVVSEKVNYCESSNRKNIVLPQIFWKDGRPWREANLWAMRRFMEGEVKIKTVDACMAALICYADYLELNGFSWSVFSGQKRERNIILYRGWLIDERKANRLAASTVSEYMRVVIAFYRWVKEEKILGERLNLWREKSHIFTLYNKEAFERTITVTSTGLAIPNRQRPGIKLEDGLFPVSPADRDAILDFCLEACSEELHLMLCLGFFTGLRIGSICDLKLDSLHNAVEDPLAIGLRYISVGPSASPPVDTKFDVDGRVWIPQALLDICIAYSVSLRRSRRQAKAHLGHQELLFLTRYGKPYCRRENEKSTAINEEMSRLRRLARKSKIVALYDFHFHQSRCTFATGLATIAFKEVGEINGIGILMEALLHANERDCLNYIKYARSAPVKAEMANGLTKYFLGTRFGFQNSRP